MPAKKRKVASSSTTPVVKKQAKKTCSANTVSKNKGLSGSENTDCEKQKSGTSCQTAEIVSAVIDELSRQGLLPQATNRPCHSQSDQSLQAVPARFEPSSPDLDCYATDSIGSVDCQVRSLLAQDQIESQAATPSGIANIQNMASYSLMPGAFVDIKVKQAIWNDQFIEFHDLLSQKKSVPADLLINMSGKTLSIVSPKQEAKLLPIGQWLTAFHIFLDIYKEKHASEISGLLAYCSLIRDLDRAYGTAAFNFYDRSFRAHKQYQPLQWGTMHTELYIKATTHSLSNKHGTVQSHFPRKKPLPCFNFNKPQGCNFRGCRYEHICERCGRNHPKFKCFSNTRTSGIAAVPASSTTTSPSEGNQPFRAKRNNTNTSKQ